MLTVVVCFVVNTFSSESVSVPCRREGGNWGGE